MSQDLFLEYGRVLFELGQLRKRAAEIKKQLSVANAAPLPQQLVTTTALSPGQISPEEQLLFRPGRRYNGLRAKVARHFGLSGSFIGNVIRGFYDRPDIIEALRTEMRVADVRSAQELDPQFEPITAAEQRHFRKNWKYSGLQRLVAEQLGVSRNSVSAVCTRRNNTPRIVSTLRAEMARVDAEIAAKSGGTK